MPDTIKAAPKKPISMPTTLADVVNESPTPLKKPSSQTKETKKPAQLVNINNFVLSNSVSINSKTFTEDQENKKDVEIDLSNKPKEVYTHDAFLKKWKEFQNILIKKGKVSLATVFEYQPKINNDTIELLVENKALQEEFDHYKSDFIEHIRSGLNNYNIQVATKINKTFKTKKAYTPQEKYEKMIAKNPALALLKRKLNMDIGYS